MLLTLVLASFGCSRFVEVEVDWAACTDWTPGEEDAIEVTPVDGDWRIAHTGVVQGCADVFEPEVVGEGRVLTVREYWVDRTEDDCTVCFEPTVILLAPPAGPYEVGWYVGDDPSPVDVVEFEVD